MKLTLLSDCAVRLEQTSAGLTVESISPDQEYSPFHMMAGALAYCSLSVLLFWAEQSGLEAGDLTLEVAWTFSDKPHRVGSYDLRFSWPSLPAKRLEAAKRVAEACAVHATLRHPPTITIDGTVAAPSDVGPAQA